LYIRNNLLSTILLYNEYINNFIKFTGTRWFDFDQLHSEFSLNESSVPWDNPILQSVQPIHPPKELYNVKNNSHDNFTNNHILNEIVQTSTPSSIESFSVSISSSDFEEPVTPIKEISKIDEDLKKSPKKKYTNVKKLQEENNNNNKNYVIEDDDIKNRSISSNSSRSDVTDEKVVSYAEVIKQTKPKQSVKAEIIIDNFKNQPMKSYRIPPSKRSSIKIPDTPFLPNHQYCVFCKNNGEEESIYRTHLVKDELKNVKCPFLSMYTCPQCKATGTKAHTISKCPMLINKINIKKLKK